MPERIARLCAHPALHDFDDFVRHADRLGVAGALTRIVAGMRTGTDPAVLAPDLDLLEEAFAQQGVDLADTPRAYRPLPVGDGHPVVRAGVCPAPRRCTRVVLPADSEARCVLVGQPLLTVDL